METIPDTPRAVYPAEAAVEVHAALAEARDEAPDGVPLPTAAQLAGLLETAFFATLTDDEGRPTEFRLAYTEPGVRWPGWSGIGILARQLGVETLRRLAPAAAPTGAAIAVRCSAEGMLVWGFLHAVSGEPDAPGFPGFELVGRGRGVLDVNLAGRRIASLVRGTLRLYARHLHERELVARLAEAAPAVAGPAPHANLLAILRVADALASLDHGGTLLVVPAGPYEVIAGLRPHPRFAVAPDARGFLAAAVAEFRERNGAAARAGRRASFAEVDFDEWVEDRIRDRGARRSLEQGARLVAGLAAVDGAVVMTAALEVLAFGAMIDVVPDPELAEIVAVDPLDPTVRLGLPPQAFGGARHASAIAFCRQQPGGALAFVSSQDGTLTLFVRTAADVVALRPLDLTAART